MHSSAVALDSNAHIAQQCAVQHSAVQHMCEWAIKI